MLKPLQDAILHLFAILAAQGDDSLSQQTKNFIMIMLSEVLPQDSMDEALNAYDNYLATYSEKTGKKGLSVKSVRFLKKAEEISSKLAQEERHLICLRTMEFVTQYAKDKPENLDFVRLIAEVFRIDEQVYRNIHDVVSGKIIHSKFQQNTGLTESLSVLFISDNEIYAKIIRDDIPEHPGLSNKLYFRLQYQQSIVLDNNSKLLYSDILRTYIPRETHPYKLHIKQLSYSIGKKQSFFHGLNLSLESPGLCAVVGPSGAGKSTLLKLMAGILNSGSGSIEFSPAPPKMAMIPQEDSINPDLTVKSQLRIQAKKYRIKNPVSAADEILQKTGLTNKADCLPGSPDNSMLSGGERKRLSIGCGIISKPDILICDEPSSGLSFDDTNKIIWLLRNIANENCLVICSLHQPDASVIAYFDNMLYLDEGGHPVYFGSPNQFTAYIENILHQETEKLPDKTGASQLAYAESLIREKKPDEFGRPTQKRKHPPGILSKHFFSNYKYQSYSDNASSETKTIKPKFSKIMVSELAAFFNRKSYSTMMLLYAPVMALLLAPICRFSGTGDYTPLNNPHFPVFFIITVVVAIFSGLIFSLGELSRRQSEHKRNWVTEKSNKQIILSKICLLLPAGLLQALIFSIISLVILDIMYMFVPLAMTYFILYLFASAPGLVLSAVSNGKTWAYLLVPVFLIPQILFSGAMIPWQKFPYHNEKDKAPVVSRFFAAAWAYEGLLSDALYLYPETDYDNEKAYFISSYFLLDVLPFWNSYCDNTNSSDSQCITMLQNALPPEIQEQLNHQNKLSSQELQTKLNTIFEATLNKENHIANTRHPLLWHQMQYTDLPPVEISDDILKLNMYPLYLQGNICSYKSAHINLANTSFRHAYISWLFILLMGIIQYVFLFSGYIGWPWKKI